METKRQERLTHPNCPVVVVGISGVAQSAKSRVADAIVEDLPDTFPTEVVRQDSFRKGSVIVSSESSVPTGVPLVIRKLTQMKITPVPTGVVWRPSLKRP